MPNRLLRHRATWVLAATMLLAASGVAQEHLHEVAVEKEVMVPIRDGTSLATDVYLPAADTVLRELMDHGRDYSLTGWSAKAALSG